MVKSGNKNTSCIICNRNFLFYRRGNGKLAKYCSQKCYHISRIGKKGYDRNGDKNPRWKGGIKIRKDGYISIYSPFHPFANSKYVYKHRLVMEKFLKRFLNPNEVVHHKNKDKHDNRRKNLLLFQSNAEHLKYELKGRKYVCRTSKERDRV